MVAMVMDKLVLSVCTYICHNTLYLLVGKQSFSVPEIFPVEALVSNLQQFKKCPGSFEIWCSAKVLVEIRWMLGTYGIEKICDF